MQQLCKTLKTEYDQDDSQATVNGLIRAMSAQHENIDVVLLCDEVTPWDPDSGGGDRPPGRAAHPQLPAPLKPAKPPGDPEFLPETD